MYSLSADAYGSFRCLAQESNFKGGGMLTEALARQRLERAQILSRPYVPRTKTKVFEADLASGLISVVIGPRRAGKSLFCLHNFYPDQSAYINLDDEQINRVVDYDKLIQAIRSVYGDTKYLFFDEIQNLPRWELFVNRLSRQGYQLLLTGSNSHLLSKELASSLTGRHKQTEILPFGYLEYLTAVQLTGSAGSLPDFMKRGGYPELVMKGLDPRGYLDTLAEAILFKDVVKRHKVRFSQKLYDLELYLINNLASLTSLERLTNILRFKSWATLSNYLQHLEDAYLVCTLHGYSFKMGELLKSPIKVYTIDNGFYSAQINAFSENTGRLLENLVFIELVKKGFVPNRDLFYYKTRNAKEVDFFLRKGGQSTCLIQVCLQVNDPYTVKREVRALQEAAEELHCEEMSIITLDENSTLGFDDGRIKVRGLEEWLRAL